MNSPDTDLAARLRTAADSAHTDAARLIEGALAHGRRRRQRRRLQVAGVMVGMLAVFAVFAGSVFAVMQLRGEPGSSLVTANDPSLLEDAAATGFAVAAPDFAPIGPQTLLSGLEDCTPSGVVSRAVVREFKDGVMGVVSIDGPDCELKIDATRATIVDTEGRILVSIPRRYQDAGDTELDGYPLSGGLNWGFAWHASWCGPRAAYLVLPGEPRGGYGAHWIPSRDVDFFVPLNGPQPSCTDEDPSILVPGRLGELYEGVLPSPPDWENLHLDLSLASGESWLIEDMTVTVTNEGAQPVELFPCPEYAIAVETTYDDGSAKTGAHGTLDCLSQDVRIEPGGARIFSVAPLAPSTSDGQPLGFRIRFGIAGVEPTEELAAAQ